MADNALLSALRAPLAGLDANVQMGLGLARQVPSGLWGAGRGMASLLRGEGGEAAGLEGARGVEEADEFLRSRMPGFQTPEGARTAEAVGAGTEALTDRLAERSTTARALEGFPEAHPALAAGGLGLLEVANPAKAVKAGKAATKAIKAAKGGGGLRADIEAAALGYDPAAVATRYPEKLPGLLTTDPKSGKEFLAKQQSPEALAVEKARKAAQKAIDKGEYAPHFPVEERFHIQDTSRYPLAERTAEVALPKKQATIDKFREQFDTPEARARLEAAYEAKQGDPLSHNWYAMGQLEREFVNELGPEAGAQAFRQRFSQPMAATTGGADPTGNLLMGAYGNYLRENQLPQPQGAWDMPYPIGGRYASGNMEMYDKVLNQGKGLSATDQPKRHNFAANFEGHTDRSTIDEQMMQAFDPKLAAPPGASYGVTEGVVNDLAAGRGVSPADYQGVVWTGLKDTQGKPMIQVVNEAIERTRRVTGKDPKDIVRDSLIKGTHPLYGVGGLGVGTAAMLEALRGGEEEKL